MAFLEPLADRAPTLGMGLSLQASAEGFPALARVASGFGYYNVDKGFDDRMALYGTLGAFTSYHNSEHHSGFRLEGGGAWTNKLGAYLRKALDEETVLELDVEEGFNLNGQALDQHWKQIGSLCLAVAALRNKRFGKVEYGKTYGMGTPTYADPFLAVYGSPYTFLTLPPPGKGAFYLDMLPKHTLAYTTPSLAGWSLGTAMTFGFNDTASSGKTLRGQGVKLQYNSPSLMLLGSYNQYLSDPWDDNGHNRQTRNHYSSASVFYDFGPLASSLTWQRQDVDYATTPSMEARTLGLMAPVGRTDVARLLLVHRDLEFGERDATGVMLGYDHFLQSNLALYLRVALIDNQSQSSLSHAGIPLEQPGDDPHNVAIGVYYHF